MRALDGMKRDFGLEGLQALSVAAPDLTYVGAGLRCCANQNMHGSGQNPSTIRYSLTHPQISSFGRVLPSVQGGDPGPVREVRAV